MGFERLLDFFFSHSIWLAGSLAWSYSTAPVAAQDNVDETLFVSSVFAPAGVFTRGIEGPACDLQGNLYAVNYQRQGTIGQVTPDGQHSLFVELPAGWVKLGIRSDDSVKAQAGYINNPVDGVLLGQVDGNVADITLTMFVQEAGVYPMRVVYQEATGDAHIELFSFLADGITRVLLNDTANGGLRTYSTGVAPEKPTAVPEFTGIERNTDGSITIEWTGGTLQSVSTVGGGGQWQNVGGATSPYTVTPGATPAAFYRVAQ